MINPTIVLGIRVNPKLDADLRRRAAAVGCKHADLARWALHLAAAGVIGPPQRRRFGLKEYDGGKLA